MQELPETSSRRKKAKFAPLCLLFMVLRQLYFRDQYGFKKESQWLSHHDFVIFENYYIPIMERRRQKWAIFMNDSHGQLPPRSAKRKFDSERDLQGHTIPLVTLINHIVSAFVFISQTLHPQRNPTSTAWRGKYQSTRIGGPGSTAQDTSATRPHSDKPPSNPDYPFFGVMEYISPFLLRTIEK